jgi:hypothetical protein
MIVGLAVSNLEISFTDEENTYLSAPQQLSSAGLILGHVIQPLSTTRLEPSNPSNFSFCEIAQATNNGVLTTTAAGPPTGSYRMSSILTASNQQPVLLPVIQHGAVDDIIFVKKILFVAVSFSHQSPSSAWIQTVIFLATRHRDL